MTRTSRENCCTHTTNTAMATPNQDLSCHVVVRHAVLCDSVVESLCSCGDPGNGAGRDRPHDEEEPDHQAPADSPRRAAPSALRAHRRPVPCCEVRLVGPRGRLPRRPPGSPASPERRIHAFDLKRVRMRVSLARPTASSGLLGATWTMIAKRSARIHVL